MLSRAGVADRLAHRGYPAGQSRFRNDPAAPHRFKQLIFADDTIAVLHEMDQQVEDLRLKRDRLAAAAQFATVEIEQMIAEAKLQTRAPAADRGRAFSAKPKGYFRKESGFSQSLRPGSRPSSADRSQWSSTSSGQRRPGMQKIEHA